MASAEGGGMGKVAPDETESRCPLLVPMESTLLGAARYWWCRNASKWHCDVSGGHMDGIAAAKPVTYTVRLTSSTLAYSKTAGERPYLDINSPPLIDLDFPHFHDISPVPLAPLSVLTALKGRRR
jgi:hypothetical protein